MTSNKGENMITRRAFINSIIAIFSVPAILWWLYVGRRDEKMSNNEKSIMVGSELPSGISFIGSAILINNGQQPRAFEAKCTHLGCKLKTAEADSLVCQCHGSKFDLAGVPTQGPARDPLLEMEIRKDKNGNYLIVQ